MCRKCGTEETSGHILRVRPWPHSGIPTYQGYFFLDPDDINKLCVGAIWRFGNATGLL